MKAALSTASLYPMLLENAVTDVCSRGAERIEIFVNTHSETEPSYVRELKKITDFYGTQVVSIHPFTCGIEPMMLFTDYERRFTDMLEYYKRFFDMCNLFGAHIFVLHGNKPVNPVSDEFYFERFARLHRLGKEFDVSVAQENVERCTAGKLSFMKKMVEALGNEAEFVLDTKQALRSGEDIFEVVNNLKDRIKHIHFSDSSPERDCMKYKCGCFDNAGFFDLLESYGFDGEVTLELYKRDYTDADDLVNNYKLLKTDIDARA